ncbi:DUF368 domain-containing protein [Alteromonas sp. ASW11-36]|uniref:DUF368 domain-containing protein n=1 Tax=Alteromonas arenosi TaxID=3055817 RepID=A0ABT7SXM9_9ALTE|nr:DUF368 domain-containing protein [Alteromonas sp. ASW11-36]MDM7860946.1 DUF368 domain-containing protein [Alteromonas sp. ASW11-36]
MKSKLMLFLKGFGMGAADVVPGVSGGTIAFITGIYEELLNSIKSVDVTAFKLFFSGKFKLFWQHINGTFLLVLFGGIGVALFSLAKLIIYLLENHPVQIWSFFFGLIIASALLMIKTVKTWNSSAMVALIAGGLIAYFITGITSVADENASLYYIFLCGMIAICAMILPGISGSFILLLLGSYELVLRTVKSAGEAAISANLQGMLDVLPIILVFAGGCIVGLAAFSRVLSWLFQHYHDLLVALLIGFLFGSLNRVWPWKESVQALTDKHNIEVNISPFRATELYGDNYLLAAISLCIVGLLSVLCTEWLAKKLSSLDVG